MSDSDSRNSGSLADIVDDAEFRLKSVIAFKVESRKTTIYVDGKFGTEVAGWHFTKIDVGRSRAIRSLLSVRAPQTTSKHVQLVFRTIRARRDSRVVARVQELTHAMVQSVEGRAAAKKEHRDPRDLHRCVRGRAGGRSRGPRQRRVDSRPSHNHTLPGK